MLHLSLSVLENDAMKKGDLSLMLRVDSSSSSSSSCGGGSHAILCAESDGLLSTESSAHVNTTVLDLCAQRAGVTGDGKKDFLTVLASTLLL